MSFINNIEIPLIKATNQNLKGYGYLVDDFDQCEIEIVTWPTQGWRKIEEGTGNEGGVTEGPFETWWKGNILYGRNNAVEHKSKYDKDGKYLLGYSYDPDTPKTRPDEIQELLLGAEELFPNIRNYKPFRTWSGVRPLVKLKNINNTLPLPRSHLVIDHEGMGLKNFLTVVEGL